jgi:hypothetical protein
VLSSFIRELASRLLCNPTYNVTNIFNLVFSYVIYVAVLGVRAQKLGVERVWHRPIHTLEEGLIALSGLEGDAETGLCETDANSVTPVASAEMASRPQ